MAVLKTGDDATDKALRAILGRFEELERKLKGVYIEKTLAAATPTRFTHKLGKRWAHWYVTRSTLTEPIYEVRVSETDRDQEIWLQSASAGTVEIFLY